MKFQYAPYILKKFAGGRLFFVNANMPFELFLDCFHFEQPFFLFSRLDDGRVAITPNVNCIPLNLIRDGFWPHDLFPTGYEYVTMKDGTYPVIITAHPVARFEEWVNKFERCIISFAQQTLAEFVATTWDFTPLKEAKKIQFPTREPVTT